MDAGRQLSSGGDGSTSPAEEPVFDVPVDMVDALAVVVASTIPLVMDRIPSAPAAELGRRGVPALQGSAPTTSTPFPSGSPSDSPVQRALRSLGPLLPERVLGALELTVDSLQLDVLDGLGAQVKAGQGSAITAPPTVAVAFLGSESEAVSAVSLLDRLRPGTTGLVATLVDALTGHDAVAAQLVVGPDAVDEPAITARHGAAHLALAVVAAAMVLRALDAPIVGATPPVVVGTALGAAALLLPTVPMPPAYSAALLAKRRAEHLLPRWSSGSVVAGDHRFALTEGAFPESVEVAGNGLVAVAAGGVVIHTGVAEGQVSVLVNVLAHTPGEVELDGWDEVVEVSWTATAGAASVIGPTHPSPPHLQGATPPWPGDYRVRVHAHGRDDGAESYLLTVWSAPVAPEIVHKRTDRLGHRLRGEPEPPVVAMPQAEYRWITTSPLQMAATVTVVAGASSEDVLRAFDADPAAPASLTALSEDQGIDPWVAVLAVDGVVLAVEANGWQGAQQPVLRSLSQRARAASMYWNVEGVTQLSFARNGEVLTSFERPSQDPSVDPEVATALDGLDFDDHRDKVSKGLVAVERFTGRGVRPEDLARIEAVDVAYPILPQLPELYAEERLPDGSRRWSGGGPLAADTDALASGLPARWPPT